MSDKNITEALKDCDDIKDTIMKEVKSSLKKNGIKFNSTNDSEIVITNSNMEDIVNVLKNLPNIPYSKAKIILHTSDVNGKIYIRQKFN